MQSRWTYALITAAMKIANRRIIDAVVDCWLTAKNLQDEQLVRTMEPQLSAQIIPAVADALWEDEETQDIAWERMSRIDRISPKFFRNWVYGSSRSLQRIDAAQVVLFLLNAYGEENFEQRYRIGLRIDECVHPRQMRGWELDPSAETVRALCDLACMASGMMGESSTIKHRSKIQAWSTLLSLGRPDILPSFDQGIGGENNGFVIAEVLKIAACFRNNPLPERVPALLATQYEGMQEGENQRVAAHIAAVRVAHSAGTEAAFHALLAFKPIREGVLISVIEAIADTSASLIRGGKTESFASLLEAARSSGTPHRRAAAVASIARLLRAEIVTTLPASELIEIARDKSVDIYARRELLEATGHLPRGCFTDSDLGELRSIAVSGQERRGDDGGDEELGELVDTALSVLAHQGHLADDGALLDKVLGLQRTVRGWQFAHERRIGNARSHVVGVLFSKEPDEFAPAISQIIANEGVSALYRLVPFIEEIGLAAPAPVVTALMERCGTRWTGGGRRRQRSSSSWPGWPPRRYSPPSGSI